MILQNKRKFASILFVLISFVCMAQSEPPPPTPPPGTPIDGGLFILLALGLLYGVLKILKEKRLLFKR